MKKIITVYLLIFSSVSLFSQNHTYGLSQDDINLLLGEYVPSIENARNIYRWIEKYYTWGRQRGISSIVDFVIIDYASRTAGTFDDIEYENYLVFFHFGLIFFISDIEKISVNEFILSLSSMYHINNNFRAQGVKDMGQLVITFLDDRHMIISNINYIYGFIFGQQWWKSAGPTVTND